jgi:hypothetical protein
MKDFGERAADHPRRAVRGGKTDARLDGRPWRRHDPQQF